MSEFHPPILIQEELDAALEKLLTYCLQEFHARRNVSLVAPYGQLITLTYQTDGYWGHVGGNLPGEYPVRVDVVESWIRRALAFSAKLA